MQGNTQLQVNFLIMVFPVLRKLCKGRRISFPDIVFERQEKPFRFPSGNERALNLFLHDD